jgi:hypothetical protein
MASALHTGGDVMVRYEEEERIYHKGFRDGWTAATREYAHESSSLPRFVDMEIAGPMKKATKKRRKLSKWQQFVKAKSKLPRFKYKTGKRKGMVNMKAVAAAWKKVPKSRK